MVVEAFGGLKKEKQCNESQTIETTSKYMIACVVLMGTKQEIRSWVYMSEAKTLQPARIN